MAGSFFLLFDDIASLLDDVATMTKVAAHKSAGVLGDDLALNAEQVTGVRADREIPVVFAVGRGSLVNKIILIPLAMAISYFASWLIIPLLMIGGSYLSFEGFEKVTHRLFHGKDGDSSREELKKVIHSSEGDVLQFEKEKIKGAIRTDFVLSAEIIVLTLGSVSGSDYLTQLLVLAVVGVIMTLGVYGIVAVIVKLDDLGLYLIRNGKGFAQTVGKSILFLAPQLMKLLSVAGTVAMFLVGGGIMVHGIPALHHMTAQWVHGMALLEIGINGVVGIITGGLVFLFVTLISLLRKKPASH